MLVCESCKFLNFPGSVFCGECGRRLPEQEETATAPVGSSEEQTAPVSRGGDVPKSTDPSGRIVVSRDTRGDVVVKKVVPDGRFLRHDCPFCKRSVKVPDGAGLCPYCGGSLDGSEAPRAEEELTMAAAQARDPAAGLAVLWHLLPTGDEREIHLEFDVSVIGRQRGLPTELVFPKDPFLSPAHAEFRYLGERIRVVDRDSLNGVFIQIREPRPLEDGQLVCMGEQILRFETVNIRAGGRDAGKDGTVPLGSGLDRPGARLVKVLADGGDGPEFHLCGTSRVFGRQGGHYGFPDDPLMSQTHAEIEDRSGRYWISDLQSTNGTMVRIREADLEPGEILRLGSQQFRIEYRPA